MRKQINHSIKAHLLWSALILLSLLAICAIPFALAQRQPVPAAKIPLQSVPPSTSAAVVHEPSYQRDSTSYSDVPFLKPQTALVPELPVVCTNNGTLGTAPPGGDTGTLATRIFRPGTPTVMCGIAPTWPGNIDTGPFIYNVHQITNSGGSPLCTTVTLHVVTEGTAGTNMQCSAFMAPFVAGDITNQTRYLGDSGVSTGNPPVDTTFQLTVPANTTIALVVLNVNASPAGQGTVYQVMLNQDIFCQQGTPTPTPTGTPSPTPGSCTLFEAESSTLTGSAVVQSCPTCSNGHKVGYVGNNSGTIEFAGVSAIASGNYTVRIWYTNGDAVRYALLSVNGSSGTPLSFPSTGSFQTVGSIETTITLNAGSNTLKFYNPIVGSWAPDFDRLGVSCASLPGVTTNPATNVASFSATLNGTVNPHGLATAVHFQYGTTTSYGQTTTSQTKTGNTFQAVSANISGLTASTTYHFRMVTTNGAGTTYGSDRAFTTLSPTGRPVVTTNPASLIASFSARLNGSVDPHGLSTAVYFQYGATTSYGLTSSPQTKTGNTYQNVAASISGLSARTTYHFRIVATNSAGTTYGADQTFTTLSATGSPVVTTNPATNVASHSATLNSTVNPHGLSTSVHFQYGTSTSYGSNTASQNLSGNTYQNASANITGLSGSTTYHFRVVATNSAGTTHGSDKTFTTP